MDAVGELTDGEPGDGLAAGNWINPALFTGVRNDMRIAREEVFGPVLTVIHFRSEEEAVAIANDSVYGLAGAVYTTDISRAFRVARAIRSGSIGINNYASVPNAPMGGAASSAPASAAKAAGRRSRPTPSSRPSNINLDA